jgi:UDP:flavonoid glycosyltransferase YjiC (YdhE family)
MARASKASLRFLLATYGSRGDVHPMLALGRALLRRGHDVQVAGPPDFAALAVQLGLRYRPMGRSVTAFLAAHRRAVHGGVLALARAIKSGVGDEVANQFELLAELAPDADCLVSTGLVFAARSCAEQAGRRFRFLAFAPEVFPSRRHPAFGTPSEHLPRCLFGLSWWAARRLDNWLLRGPINRGRARLGLPPIRDVLAHFADPAQSLLATDGELAPAPADVAVCGPPTGALLLEQDAPLPAEVERFLAEGPPPVFIGFGSMPDVQPERSAACLVAAVRRAGCRAIVATSTPPPAPLAMRANADILAVGELCHAQLFPRVALVVHHGGAGTCARAARAGVPQVILPHLLDQFHWARRLAARGLAPRPLHRRRLTGRALAARIHQALADPAMRERAASLARQLAGRDGADALAAILVAAPGATDSGHDRPR